MSLGRFVVELAAGAAALLAAGALVAAGGGRAVVGTVILAITLALAVGRLWRRGLADLGAAERELEGEQPVAVGVRRLHERLARCREERDRTETLLLDLTASLGEALMVVDADLKVRLVNRVAARFCGLDEVVAGGPLVELVRHPKAVAAVRAAALEGRADTVVLENPRGLWELRAFPIRGGGAVVLAAEVGLVRRAAELRRRFVEDLSHELRSPLTVLRTTVEALEGELPDDLAAVVVRQVERLDRLAGELSELASIESGEAALALTAVEVAPVAERVLRDHLPEAKRVGVDVVTRIDASLVAVCDRRGLARVLSNLIDNAIKYNRAGGRVELRGRRRGERVEIEVEDSGEGIPAGELEAVLQRFYRVDRARTPGRGGLGLGLAIVKHLVQAMDGRLELTSREQVGTAVTVDLPAAATPSPPDPDPGSRP